MGLVRKASRFTHVFVIVGDNDAKERSVEYIYENFRKLANAVYPTKLRFCGHFKRKDLAKETVQNNNLYYYRRFGVQYKSPRAVKNKDFHHKVRYHFNRQGEGYRHMSVLILSVLKEFSKFW